MRERRPGEGRDFREDVDDMGDDEQEEEIALTEQYVEDPPDDHVIGIPEESEDGVGIGDYEKQSARRGEEERWPEPNVPAESDAVNPTRQP